MQLNYADLLINIRTAYSESIPHLVDAEKDKKIKFLDIKLTELNTEKERISNKIKETEDESKKYNDEILTLEREFNTRQNQVESKYAELLRNRKNIFDDFNAKVTSGKIFTDEILNSVLSAYKTGFIGYLPTYYSQDEVANRVRQIDEQATKNNN